MTVLNQLAISAELPDGTPLPPEDSQSYVWRLAPHVDHAWETFFTDTRDQGLLSELHAEFDTGRISERPAYGLNSIFVGGDSVHGGSDVVARHPWQSDNEAIAATRFSEVKNPSRLIVFAPTAKAGTGDEVYEDPELGFCELRPPYTVLDGDMWTNIQWFVGVNSEVTRHADGDYGDGAGIPIDRRGEGLVPVAHLDGSAAPVKLADLSADMRRWNPFEVGLRGTEDPLP